MKEIECIECIVSRLSTRGTGREESPLRAVTEIYTKAGVFIGSHDPIGNFTSEQMRAFVAFCIKEKEQPSIETLKMWQKNQ